MVDRPNTGFLTSNFTPVTQPSQILPSSTVSVDTGVSAANPATVSVPLGLIGQAQNVAGAAVVAFAGGGKASATQLGYGFNRLGTVATAADSVLLPYAIAGAWVFIRNDGAASATVFGRGTDTIDAVATGTGNAQANAKGKLYYAISGVGDGAAGTWVTLLGA